MDFKTKNHLYTSGDMKREAKAQLNGHWGQAIFMAVFPTIFYALFLRNVSEVSLWSLFLDSIRTFLIVGVSFGFMNLLRNESYQLNGLQEIVRPFRLKYFRNLLFLMFLRYVITFLWSLLFIVPGIVKSYAYSQAEYIYKDIVDRTGEQPSPGECLAESERLMKGHKMDLFVLDISFIGWGILSGLTFGILGLWLTPYMSMSRVVFYESISDGQYLDPSDEGTSPEAKDQKAAKTTEEIGKDPDDFRDFDEF